MTELRTRMVRRARKTPGRLCAGFVRGYHRVVYTGIGPIGRPNGDSRLEARLQ